MPPFFFFSAHRPLRRGEARGRAGSAAAEQCGGGSGGRATEGRRRANSAACALMLPAGPPGGRPQPECCFCRPPHGAAGGPRPPARCWTLLGDMPHPAPRPAGGWGLHGAVAWLPGLRRLAAPRRGPARCNRLQGALTACGSSWSARGRQCPVPPPSRAPSLLPRKAGLSQNSQRGRAGRWAGPLAPAPPRRAAC